MVKNSWGNKKENGYFRIGRGELDIGRGGWAIKLITSGGSSMRTNTQLPKLFRTCSVSTVNDPDDYESIMSVVDFVLEEVVNEGIASPCGGDTPVTRLTVDSITNSSIQQVGGLSGVSLIANTPCREGDQHVKARIVANVFIDLNGSFILRNGTEYATLLSSGCKMLASNILLATIILSFWLAILSGYIM